MLQYLITTYGYLTIFIGTALEGEIILVIAGFAAYTGYLELYKVILVGFAGSLIGDQIFFFIGRTHGRAFLERRPRWQKKAEWIHQVLHRHKYWLLLAFRFMYGIRTVTPFAIGTSEISTKLFVVFNAIGAALWAVAFAGGGYLFGTTMEHFVQNFRHYQKEAFIGLAVLIAVIFAVNFIIKKIISKTV